MTGFIGTFLILMGYIWMAWKKNPAVWYTLGSVTWLVHGCLHGDWWLAGCNLITAALGVVSLVRK